MQAEDTRRDPPRAASERETLEAFLDRYRETMRWKVSGLSDADLRRVIVPSGWSLLGLIKHLAYVERNWFRVRFLGEDGLSVPWTDEDPDADFRIELEETTEQILGFYADECERSRAIAAGEAADAPVDPGAHDRGDRPPRRARRRGS